MPLVGGHNETVDSSSHVVYVLFRLNGLRMELAFLITPSSPCLTILDL